MNKDLLFLEHILESIENVELFTKNVSQESFFKNKEKLDLHTTIINCFIYWHRYQDSKSKSLKRFNNK